jgi:hypothetical protein
MEARFTSSNEGCARHLAKAGWRCAEQYNGTNLDALEVSNIERVCL